MTERLSQKDKEIQVDFREEISVKATMKFLRITKQKQYDDLQESLKDETYYQTLVIIYN